MAERCIYADDFLDLFYVASAGQDKMFVKVVEQVVEDTPTADVVEVVRCEKCKYFREYSDAHKRAVERADGDCFLKLTHSCDEQFIACRYNDFCSYGTRK